MENFKTTLNEVSMTSQPEVTKAYSLYAKKLNSEQLDQEVKYWLEIIINCKSKSITKKAEQNILFIQKIKNQPQ